ncbi:DUF4139 domain-containing protein [Basilea psittacipulmonis]|nr:DUF4139 domain-containing protein [Basilea psittacipulmonis]
MAKDVFIDNHHAQITIFSQNAQINLEKSISLEKGVHTIRLTNIPSTIKPTNLYIQPIDGVKILKKEVLEQNKDGELDKEIKAVNQRIKNLDNQRALILTSPIDQKDFTNIFKDRQKLLNEIEDSLEKEYETYNELQKRLLAKQILITLQTDKALNERHFLFSYIDDKISWQPHYLASFSQDHLNFYSYALINNESIDYPDASINFSTATLASYIPQNYRWELREANNNNLIQATRMVKMAKFSADSSDNAPESHAYEVKTKETWVSSDIQIDGPQSINTGLTQLLLKDDINTQAKISYQAWPMQNQNVFLIARKPLEQPIYAGMLDTYINHQYLSSSYIENTAKGGELSILLGIDNRISLKTQKNVQTKKTGKQYTVTYEYRYQLQNTLSKEVNLTLNLVLPISSDERIKVTPIIPKNIKLGHVEQKESADTSEVNWINEYQETVTLPAGSQKEVIQKFTVTYPDNMTVSGLRGY